ncbi:hypothetical protein ACK3SF_00385 [Candidatus Nanosalina sp. VS9-1]|uniref:hypothetical protein n=1 Tax=Candidatus Nanosalina sp. VS9-1 TaxID=3388566 RepID=UPI0039E05ACD
MSLKGWAIAIILSPFTLGLSVPLYFWYWFLKKIGKWYIRGLKIFFLMPAAIVLYIIARIIEAIVGDVEWLVSIFTGGIRNMEAQGDSAISIPGLSQFKLRYIAAFAVALYVDFVLFIQPLVSGGVPEFSFATFTSFFAVGLPFIVLVIFSGLINKWQGADISGSTKKLAGSGVAAGAGAAGAAAAAPGEAVGSAAGGAANAAGAAKDAAEMYEDIEVAEAAETVSAGGAEAAGAEGIIAAVGGSSVAAVGGPILLAAIAAWIIYSIIAIVISIILLGMTWGYVSQLLPIIAGPIMGAIGLGSSYANWFGESTTNQFAPQVDTAFAEEKRAIQQVGARLGCVLEGPQCLRQWRMNNTVRPGSEAVGETYELSIDQFGLGVERIDTAYKEENYVLPVNFLVSNARNGLKGITARDVKYKILIKDADKTYCSTSGDNGQEWRSITSQGLTGDDIQQANYILPGLGVSPTQSLEELNLADCELLQPSMGVNRVMELQLKYNYSSQATLYFDAMSREHRREQGMQPGFKESETAKTPVQSYINVQSPVTYYETENGDRRAVPFSARFGFETPGASAEYKIDPESIEIRDSSLTAPTSQCSGLSDSPEGENVYTISEAAQNRIILRQNEGWFSNRVSPAPLRCTMTLSEPEQISPTGEELIMRVDANYTVKKTTQMESFSVWNTACNRVTCPLIVTEQYNESSDNNLFFTCSSGNSVDSRDGCSVRVPAEDDGINGINWQMVTLAERGGSDIIIESGKKAVQVRPFLEDLRQRFDMESGFTQGNQDTHALITDFESEQNLWPEMPVGVSEQRVDNAISQYAGAGLAVYENMGSLNNLRFRGLSGALCEQQYTLDVGSGSKEQAVQDYRTEWLNDYGDRTNLFMFQTSIVDCERSIGQYLVDSGSCSVEQGGNLLGAAGQFLDPTQSVDSDQFSNVESCMNNAQRVKSCSQGSSQNEIGVLIRSGGELQCYGGTFQN